MKTAVAEELRKQAGIVASAKFGKDIRNAISASLTDIALVLEEEEIPVRKMAVRIYFRGIITRNITRDFRSIGFKRFIIKSRRVLYSTTKP